MIKRALIPIIPALACAALFAAPAFAAEPEAVSQNWAGYEVAPTDSSGFSSASGSWVQPTASCTAGNATYSAFWVGLGGGSEQSQALEQIGTQADCSASGAATYFAWYELVPSAPVQLSLSINPGDQISARVQVSGDSVTVSLNDVTTGGSVTRTLTTNDTDTSTAEWVAESPSECSDGVSGACQPLPLTDFGTVKFTNASATADGQTGSISNSSWTSQSIALSPAFDNTSSGGAEPSSLSSDGSEFSVTYSADASEQTSAGAGGYGYGRGSGYGDSGGDTSSSGSGYPGSGYGYGGGYGYGASGGYGTAGGYGDPDGYSYYGGETGAYGYTGGYGYSSGDGFVYGYGY